MYTSKTVPIICIIQHHSISIIAFHPSTTDKSTYVETKYLHLKIKTILELNKKKIKMLSRNKMKN